jgi:hypothetical protein
MTSTGKFDEISDFLVCFVFWIFVSFGSSSFCMCWIFVSFGSSSFCIFWILVSFGSSSFCIFWILVSFGSSSFCMLWLLVSFGSSSFCRSTEHDHVKDNLPAKLLRIRTFGKMKLEEFKDLISPADYKLCESKMEKHPTWYPLTLDVFVKFLYKVIIHFFVRVWFFFMFVGSH